MKNIQKKSLDAMHAAQGCGESLRVCFYLYSWSGAASQNHFDDAISQFKNLADALGYELKEKTE